MPVAYSVVLFFKLPESPRFLTRKPARWPELRKLLARMQRTTQSNTVFVDALEQKTEEKAGFAALFQNGRARDTLAIWAAFFMCLLAVYSAFSWLPAMLPAMLASEGTSPAIASTGLTAYNFGGVFGALITAAVISRYGSRCPIALCCVGGAITAYLLQSVNLAQNTILFIAGIGLHGLFVNAVNCVYPTLVRATGTDSALAFGRFGAILSSFVGAAVITAGGANGYLTLLGTAMVVTLMVMLVLRKHIPSAVARLRAATVTAV